MYCEKCGRLFTEKSPVCPGCGSRKIRQPWADDQCFLTEKQSIWAGMLTDVLTQNNIVFLRKPVLGAGLALKVGDGMERYRFYVLHAQFEKARELMQELFPEEK